MECSWIIESGALLMLVSAMTLLDCILGCSYHSIVDIMSHSYSLNYLWDRMNSYCSYFFSIGGYIHISITHKHSHILSPVDVNSFNRGR